MFEKGKSFVYRLDDEKDRLVLDGNTLRYHFLDINSDEWDEEEFTDLIPFVKEIPSDPMWEFLKKMGVRKWVNKNGLCYFIRFKDKGQEKL